MIIIIDHYQSIASLSVSIRLCLFLFRFGNNSDWPSMLFRVMQNVHGKSNVINFIWCVLSRSSIIIIVLFTRHYPYFVYYSHSNIVNYYYCDSWTSLFVLKACSFYDWYQLIIQLNTFSSVNRSLKRWMI